MHRQDRLFAATRRHYVTGTDPKRIREPPIRAPARLLKWPLHVMPSCVICIRLPAVAGVPVIGMLEMAGVLGGIGAPVGWCCWAGWTAIRG